ncbi:PAS domain-containing protein [Tsuneonella flava]|uniref:histidine kinase n=1 Tax=Tsuneonella flava TaxID=2055955 RepID=A0ABX7K7U7_9SPHN|nr:ATP-binding protein [Tsuneonella flava]QSB44318.1 PAS domain-containing protein [Tsuneonella flava]
MIAFPIVALIIGGIAFFTYRSAIAEFRADAASELLVSNSAVADKLGQDLGLVAETQRKAAELMKQRLSVEETTSFETVFTRAADGAYHSRAQLWDGTELPGSIGLRGFGGFVAPQLSSERRATVMAAFDTIKAMSGGLPSDIESLYFFSPFNDLLIYAPTRQDQLGFYRKAPADFGFQDAEFSTITSPRENPEGEMRCTSLQQPIYDTTGQNWTTGCMLPFRVDGRHLGAWGISIPLSNLTRRLQAPLNGATTVIASSDGKLIHHSALAEGSVNGLAANIDLSASGDSMLRGLLPYLDRGIEQRVEYSQALGAYVAAERLEAPDWTVFTILPDEALSDRAWAIAQRVILVAFAGALLIGIILTAVFHRTVAMRISRLADRTNRIAEIGDTDGVESKGDEIHQLKRAFDKMEDRLDQARSRESRSFDALVDAARGYAMVLFDGDGVLVRENEGATRLFGQGAIEQLAAEFSQSEGGLSKDGKRSETRMRERILDDGTAAWLEETFIPLDDEAGETFGFAYIAHDLTSLRNAQREAENSFLYLEMAQSSGQAGHFALDPQTMMITISPWLRDRLGLEEAVLHLSAVPALIDEEYREATMADIAHAIERKSDFSFETIAVGADGKPFPALLRGTTVFDEGGEAGKSRLIGYYGILQDISEQKASAQALVRALEEAKAEARARSDILAVISHEIRTPISGILGLIDQIRRERSDAERSRALTLIEESSNVLLETLDATLNRTRNERDRLEETEVEFVPMALVERVAGLFRPLARRKGLSIDLEPASHEITIGKPGRIQQIMANFVSNAVKFTSAGRITLACTGPEGDGVTWTFSVTDTGGGISPERMKTIFEPFSGSAPDTLGRSSGSGLGLSITRQLATDLGGTVEAEAAAGGGTRMIFKVPLEPAPPEKEREAARGTIRVDLRQASLAVRAEAIAEGCGFAIADPEESVADVMLSDDHEALASATTSVRILVSEKEPQAGDAAVIRMAPDELASRLAAILGEYSDD